MSRPKYIAWLHITGVALGALFIGGLRNPAIGFPIAMSIMIALEISLPKSTSKEAARVTRGSILGGGIRRGIFIREMFAGAMIYSALSNLAFGMPTASLSSALLAAALIISSLASEIEVHAGKTALR